VKNVVQTKKLELKKHVFEGVTRC